MWRDVRRKALHRHPAAHADPDRADLGLAALRGVGPDADPAFGAARGNAQRGERVDDPAFERMDIGAHVAPASRQVELDIADALAGTMIGIAPAAPGVIDGKARLEQLG